MASTQSGSADGQLNAAITRAVVHIHSQYVGRGPTKAQTFYRGPVVVTMLENGMTTAEQSLVRGGEAETVLLMRQKFRRTIGPALVSEIERLTGRTVVALMSDNHFEPDLAAEVFILDGPVAGDEDGHCVGGPSPLLHEPRAET